MSQIISAADDSSNAVGQAERGIFQPVVITLGLIGGTAHYLDTDAQMNYSYVNHECHDDADLSLLLHVLPNACKIAKKLLYASEVALWVTLGNALLAATTLSLALSRTFGALTSRVIEWVIGASFIVSAILSFIPWSIWITTLHDFTNHPENWSPEYAWICSLCVLFPNLFATVALAYWMHRNRYFSSNGYAGPTSPLPPVELEYTFDADTKDLLSNDLSDNDYHADLY